MSTMTMDTTQRALVCLVAIFLCSCYDANPNQRRTITYEIEKKYERGPVALTLKVDKKEITLADRLQFVIESAAAEEYEVELPSFGEKLQEFGILDYHSEPQRLLSGGKILSRKTYELEPFLSGLYKIPAMKIRFGPKGEKNRTHELETEALEINVKSLLPAKLSELNIKDISAPEALPQRSYLFLYLAIAGGILLILGLTVPLYLRYRRRHQEQMKKVAAHELAFDEIERLIGEELIAKGLYKEFYQRISDILRRYIENRFGLHAPERTTEEFLAELRGHSAITLYRPMLEEFLAHCDLVKFAEHQPASAEIQKTFDACKNFIVATKVED